MENGKMVKRMAMACIPIEMVGNMKATGLKICNKVTAENYGLMGVAMTVTLNVG